MKITIEVEDSIYALLQADVEGRTWMEASPAGQPVVKPVYPGGLEQFLTMRLQEVVQQELDRNPPADVKELQSAVLLRKKAYTEAIVVSKS